MTDDSFEALIRFERARGHEALREARALLEAGYPHGAAARAYYAAFHLARCLALLVKEAPSTHKGVAHFFNLHYVRTGLLEREMNRRLASLQAFREASDYQIGFVLELETARLAVADAEAFVARCDQVLESSRSET